MLKILYLYQCENTLCNNKIYVKGDVESLQLNCTCSKCADNMILCYEEINEESEGD